MTRSLVIFSLFFPAVFGLHNHVEAVTSQSTTPIYLSSEGKRTTLLELYSSQGCSSCPPAQRWVNQLQNSDKLWQSVVPVVYHVDYWDRLGWPDPFASKAFSQRQQEFKQAGKLRSVYTPGFVVEGREWKGWFSGKPLPYINRHHKGKLEVTVDNSDVTVRYHHKDSDNAQLTYHVALLGLGMNTQVKRGENRGKTLQESFIVLQHSQREYGPSEEQSLMLDKTTANAKSYAVAVWISDETLTPLQVVGGTIPSEWVN